MTDAGRPAAVFAVETIDLDLPSLVGAFSRRLREAGLAMTPERSADLARALTLVRPIARRTLYWTARAMCVSDRAQVPAFDAVFFSVFAARADVEAPGPEDARTAALPPDRRPASDHDRSARDSAAQDLRASPSSAAPREGAEDEDATELEVPLAMASEDEVLASKRFDELEPHELAQLYRLMSRLEVAIPRRRTRRFEKGRHGAHVDMRRTLRASLRTGGSPIRLARRRRRVVRRRLVMLCDISGSMEPYARAYLQFLTCVAGSGPNAEAFVFATRLTRLTRALASRSPERAIQRAAAAVPDWSSGTRIGEALKTFNDRHGRRGMARGAVIVIISDGWELGDPMLVGREMERLRRLARRIIWVNPRAAASEFSVQVGGMMAALPHCDALLSGHSFAALHEVAEAIGVEASRADGLSRATAATRVPEEQPPESWASATPVAGSSVAMPSGYGPSRGRTTPGWGTDENDS